MDIAQQIADRYLGNRDPSEIELFLDEGLVPLDTSLRFFKSDERVKVKYKSSSNAIPQIEEIPETAVTVTHSDIFQSDTSSEYEKLQEDLFKEHKKMQEDLFKVLLEDLFKGHVEMVREFMVREFIPSLIEETMASQERHSLRGDIEDDANVQQYADFWFPLIPGGVPLTLGIGPPSIRGIPP